MIAIWASSSLPLALTSFAAGASLTGVTLSVIVLGAGSKAGPAVSRTEKVKVV